LSSAAAVTVRTAVGRLRAKQEANKQTN
jgi:hypothetical protein